MNTDADNHLEDDPDYPGEEIEQKILQAVEHAQKGERDAALAVCKDIFDRGEIDPKRAARVSRLLKFLGQTVAADQIRDRVLDRMKSAAEANPKNLKVMQDAAMVHDFFDLEDEAVGYFERALEIHPGDVRPALRISRYHLLRDDPETAVDAWNPVLEAVTDPGRALLILARALGQYDFREKAEEILKRAEPLCHKRRREFDYVAAGIRGEARDIDQHSMAVEIFDSFASSYDDVLKELENNGPNMIGKMLQSLELDRSQSRNVLDAGCGTGLCAPYLRPLAKTLAGVDISTKMLNACREKALYDTLTRTDLSVPATYPEGSFELVVAADVLVYFGNLEEVFRCIHDKMTPGGWFIFTVERASDPEPPTGYRLNASGRHVHTLEYINGALARSGFGKAKLHFEDVIRKELGKPVTGLSVAAQKPALAMFS